MLSSNDEESCKYEQIIRIAPATHLFPSKRISEIREKKVGEDIKKYHRIISEYLTNER